MEQNYAKFVSQKISKTCWRPVSATTLQQPDVFATGSWDNEENKVSLWTIGDYGSSGMEEDYEGDPQLLCEIVHVGDVMDLQRFSINQQWKRAHYHSCDNAPCTGVVCNSPEIVTVGEDGRINLFRADHKEIVRTIDNADSSTLHAVTFLRTTEILTVNSIGQVKIWDFRQQGNEPSHIFSLTGDRVPLYCVDRHPNQQHIIATGGQDGTLSIWDVRHGSMPVSLLEAHDSEMWEVHFHPSNPDHLFTCSEDGSLWHWDASANAVEKPSFLHQGEKSILHVSRSTMVQPDLNQSLTSVWLNSDSAKGRFDVTNMLSNQILSVNSLDVLGQCLVCGTDGEAIHVIKQLSV
ncbi:nucleoporin Nup43 isoform X2 [Latimeria chalumnae]|uniref:nucleoporin Nup43 isoform X2 n=1 Tax=Latimeria chalumnae TaxID=7897 RepID=UPI0003C1821D|nr:PREDICTED: nucleoporin Nup43 isoform X2 [Latimeria chalumnae]|eukprot:XP_006007599.1 PREDICTED: nucleoporin Nup43 isoform X2 [Latimeria chalumnae]